jgi:hypothetical protein
MAEMAWERTQLTGAELKGVDDMVTCFSLVLLQVVWPVWVFLWGRRLTTPSAGQLSRHVVVEEKRSSNARLETGHVG